MVRALIAVLVLGGCAAGGPVLVKQTNPRPLLNIDRNVSVELALDAAVQDDFVIPESAQLLAVRVTGWRKSITAGFDNAFGRSTSPAGKKLVIDVVRPDFVPLVVRRSGGAVMSTSQIQYRASLMDENGQVINRTVGTVTAKKVGQSTWDENLESSLEAMYEDIGNKFFGAGAGT
jgi:hypothetical protein